MNEIIPNFLIIGFPKAGTTSVYNHLRSHPDIFMPNNTELRYFNNAQVMKHLGGPGDEQIPTKICKNQNEYSSYFKDWNGENAIGECTTNYIFYKEGLASIKSKLRDDVKLIVLLREPVSRAFSHYQYFIRREKEKLSFEDAIKEENKRKANGWNDGWFYLDNSLYSSKISNLLDLKLNFRAFLFEDFIKDPQNFLKMIYKYLNVDDQFTPENLDLTFNKGGVYKKKTLINWMLSPSKFRSSVKSILPNALTQELRIRRDKFISKQTVPLKIDQKTELELRSFFNNDVKRLSQMLDLDFTAWGYDL